MLYCFGDSFTYGYNFDRVEREQLVWPYLLSQKLNTKYKNLSIPGCSNWSIARRLMSLNIKPTDTVVIGWTHASRIEFGVNKKYLKTKNIYQENSKRDFVWMGDVVEKYDDLYCRRIIQQMSDNDMYIDKNLKYFSDLCYNNYFNGPWLEEMFLIMYNACKSVLEASGCKWIMFNTWETQYIKDAPMLEHPNYLLGYENDMTSHIRRNNDKSYWSKQEHNMVSDILYENLRC